MGSVDNSGLPQKTREVHNHHQDSTVWNDFPFRDDDIVIATFAKSGTTWTQQIVGQLVHRGDPNISAGELSPWVDLRIIPQDDLMAMLESQTHRRFMKTHLPRDAMVWNPKVKYIFIGRDGRDMIWSLHHHFAVATPLFYHLLNDTPGRVGPPCLKPSDDPRDMFIDLVEDDTRQSICWPFWSHVRSWWEVRNQPNILFVHFADMKKDLDGEMRRIAEFLEVPALSAEEWKAAVEHSTFGWMKEHAELSAPGLAEQVFEGGAKSFINKGTNGRWADRLSAEDNRRYLDKAREELGEECATWLEKGGHV